MISISSAELNAWIAAFVFPLTRILALLTAAPPFNNAGLSMQIRLALGLAITFAVAPALPPMPPIEPASPYGLLILAQQMIIGFAMGFAMRLVFTAIDLSGSMISMQMGLGFATAYDPQSASQTPVISEFLGMLALLIFMSINGHLMVLATLYESFAVLPIGAGVVAGAGAGAGIGAASWWNIANAGGVIFSTGVLLALPALVALMITNIALGILARVAPQLNIIAVGFPVTLAVGFAALTIAMSHLAPPIQQAFEYGLRSMLGYFTTAG